MQTNKTVALALTAVIAGMTLVLMPEATREVVTADNPDKVETQAFSASGTNESLPNQAWPQSNRNLSRIPAASTSSAPAVAGPTADREVIQADANWLMRLYPELVRMVNLENEHPDSALRELLPMLSDGDPVVRLAALEAIADMNHPARSSMLAAALDDPSPQIRVAAIEAFATRDDPAAGTYIEPYLFDSDAEVRLAAIETLALLENERAIYSLAGLLFDPDRLVRRQAVNALGEIGGESARTYLQQLRSDPDQTIRANAEAMLAEMGANPAY